MAETIRIMRVFILLLFIYFASADAMSSERRYISDGWEFRQFGAWTEWKSANVPGSIHSDLLYHNIIGEPYYGMNDRDIQWVGEKSWEYRCKFYISEEDLNKDNIYLYFQGLDTYCDVYLNGKLVIQTNNMFRTWKIDVKEKLESGENHLYLYFNSVLKNDVMKYFNAPYRLRTWPNNDQSDIALSVYARKAGYHYGWDWGPRILTCGIWRPVYIELIDGLSIEDLSCHTLSVGNDEASLAVELSVRCAVPSSGKLDIFMDGMKVSTKKLSLVHGTNDITECFRISDPELWWPNGAGDAKIYELECVLTVGKEKFTRSLRTGIRTVELVRAPDSYGTSFYFKVNGKDIFLKGTNYIPQDHLYSRVSKDKYRHLLVSAAESNMNAVRVWGGGIYEDDIFYDLCDSLGLMVWQDMMFACGMFPSDSSFVENVSEEVRDNVRRLRNHPSIILWNGNNENEVSYYAWGWKNRTPKKYRHSYEEGMRNLFHKAIPDAIYSLDTTRSYIPTSPLTGYNGIGHNHGDVHYWSVWKGADYETYGSNVGRFMSEYGMQSYPEPNTIYKYAGKNGMYMDSPAMISHQRARHDDTRDPYFGNKMIRSYIERYYGIPKDFESEVLLSQAVQADAVKYAIETHRRARPYCMGSLYWQLNDVWPGPSWSGIDYYGNWKALQYVVKRSFGDILVSPYMDGNNVRIDLITDNVGSETYDVNIAFYDVHGKLLSEDKSFEVEVSPDSVQECYRIEKTSIEGRCGILYVSVRNRNGEIVSSNSLLLGGAYNYDLPDDCIEVDAVQTENGYRLALESDRFVKGVFLVLNGQIGIFADNYFDMVPGRVYHIDVRTDLPEKDFMAGLSVRPVTSLYSGGDCLDGR